MSDFFQPNVEQPKKRFKITKKIFEGTTSRVLGAIFIAFIFAHILTSYGKSILNSGELIVYVDSETGVNYVGSMLGPMMLRFDAEGSVIVTPTNKK